MKLKELWEVMTTSHFKLNVMNKKLVLVEETMGDRITSKYDDYDVIRVDSTTEIEKESYITHTISVRPIILVVIKENSNED